jgi:hypothetical protein
MSTFLKTVKCIIFIIGICLVNYVGGVPNDARNLFITQTIFLAPYLVEFYNLLKIKSYLKWLIRLIWAAGILTIIANILGITGVITILKVDEVFKVMFNPTFFVPFQLNLPVNRYLLFAGIVYSSVFMGTITFESLLVLNKKLLKKRKEKESREGLVENVHSR